MKQIALFGGAFDPPHVGHALCVTNILNARIVDEVWLVPSGDSRYDKKANLPALHRKELVRLFIEDYFKDDNRVKVNLSQVEKPAEECATIDLLDGIQQLYPSDRFFVVIGSDNLSKVSQWRSAERLLKEACFIVIERLGHTMQVPSGVNAVTLPKEDLVHSDLSSSLVRKLLSESKLVSGIIGSKILEYIRAAGLYRKN